MIPVLQMVKPSLIEVKKFAIIQVHVQEPRESQAQMVMPGLQAISTIGIPNREPKVHLLVSASYSKVLL